MRKTISVLMTAVVALGLGGCGDDDDDAASEETTETTETTAAESEEEEGTDGEETESASTPTGGDLEKYCELSASLDESFPEDADADTAEELAEVLKGHYNEHEGEYQEIVKAAPDDIEEEAAKAVEILKRVADGDLTALEDPAFDEVAGTLDEFDTTHCGDNPAIDEGAIEFLDCQTLAKEGAWWACRRRGGVAWILDGGTAKDAVAQVKQHPEYSAASSLVFSSGSGFVFLPTEAPFEQFDGPPYPGLKIVDTDCVDPQAPNYAEMC